jgi:hypothetical protein
MHHGISCAHYFWSNKVPTIKLKKLNGQSVMLQNYLKEGPVLINFGPRGVPPAKKKWFIWINLKKNTKIRGSPFWP